MAQSCQADEDILSGVGEIFKSHLVQISPEKSSSNPISVKNDNFSLSSGLVAYPQRE